MKAHTSAPLNPVEAFIAKYEPNTVDGWAGFAQSFSTALRHYALESHKCTQAQETREKIADEHATGLDA